MTKELTEDLLDKSEEINSNQTALLSFESIIQMYSLERKTLTLRVKKNDIVGKIHFQDGEIYHAEVENLRGEEAFYNLLSWHPDELSCLALEKNIQRTIRKTVFALLLEGAKTDDESSIDSINTTKQQQEQVEEKIMESNGTSQDNLHNLVKKIATISDQIKGVLIVSRDGTVLSDTGIEDINTISSIILFINTSGKQIGDFLKIGPFNISLVPLKNINLLALSIESGHLGLLVDQKISIVQATSLIKQIVHQ